MQVLCVYAYSMAIGFLSVLFLLTLLINTCLKSSDEKSQNTPTGLNLDAIFALTVELYLAYLKKKNNQIRL